jgi:hypothetical protein
MTKARDIASAAPAPAGVTSTELGYVDGVTSALQTQVDAKIAKTLTTTTGDIIYASGANTPARLGIGSSAQVLTVASGVPSWATPAVSASGLTLITRQAYTSALTINVDNVFSSTYDNYRIIVRNSAGNIPGISMRLRVSSADNTTSNYTTTVIEAISGTTYAFGRYDVSQSSFYNGSIAFTGTSMWSFDVASPNLTQETQFIGNNAQIDGGFRSGTIAGIFNATTSFTGFSLYGASGTATGVVTVYGYQKS